MLRLLFWNITMTRPSAGFSLIELLIVVSIIGILSAIAAPLFGEHRANARDGMAHADAKNILQTLVSATK